MFGSLCALQVRLYKSCLHVFVSCMFLEHAHDLIVILVRYWSFLHYPVEDVPVIARYVDKAIILVKLFLIKFRKVPSCKGAAKQQGNKIGTLFY